MRKIEIVDGVRVRFPHANAEFDLGLEVGAISVLMAQGLPLIQKELSLAASEHLRPLAEKFRYTLVATPGADDDMVSVSLIQWSRPLLRLVR